MRISEIRGYVIKVADAAYLGGHNREAIASGQHGDYVAHRHYRSMYSTKTETFMVKITCDNGAVGWGEAQAPLVPEAVGAIVQGLVGPLLLGHDPFDSSRLWRRAYDAMRERGHMNGFYLDAIAACDIALWDLKGKLAGLPVSKLLGGQYRTSIPCYVSGLAGADATARADIAAGWSARGFSDFKLALGAGVDDDVATFQAVREAVGAAASISVDAHWRYTVPEAIRLGRLLDAEGGLAFLEAPIAPEDAYGQAEVARALEPPVAIGEELRTRYDFRHRLVLRSADLLQPDVGRMGITEAMEVGGLADAFNVGIALHLGVGLGVYIAAALHVAAALPNLVSTEFQSNQLEVANRLLVTPIGCDQGAYALPTEPGLGIQPDETQLTPHISSTFDVV